MQLSASPLNPVVIYYCKRNVKTGLTVRVTHLGKTTDCRGVTFTNAQGDMQHGNSTGPAKRSGARCVLVIREGTVNTL